VKTNQCCVLTEKKKAPASARKHCSSEDDGTQSSYCNNDGKLHNREPNPTVPQVLSDDEGSNLDTIRHDAFPVPTHSCAATV
jgi:hypothetical protein